MNVEIRAGIHNRFDVEVIDARTGKVRQKAHGENTICAGLWTHFMNGWGTYFQFGSGSGVPAYTDTDLFQKFGSSGFTSIHTVYDKKERLVTASRTTVLNETQFVGETFSEIGLSWTGGTGISTHAMLQDMNGNPVTIEKTETDILNIYSTVFAHMGNTGNHQYLLYDINTTTVDYSATEIPFLLTGFGAAYGSRGRYWVPALSISSGGYRYYGGTSFAYNADGRKITYVFPRLAAPDGNIHGFPFINAADSYNGQYHASDVISFDVRGNYHVENDSIGTGDGTETQFSTTFDLPENAVIKVNGTAVTATVKKSSSHYPSTYYLTRVRADSTNDNIIVITDGGENDTTGKFSYNTIFTPTRAQGTLYFWNNLGIEQSMSISSVAAETNPNNDHFVVSGSDDFANWTRISPEGTQTAIVKTNYKFYKAERIQSAYENPVQGSWSAVNAEPNVTIQPAPAVGAVISADYDTKLPTKDSNHVWDFAAEITFNEYTPE